MSSQSALDEQVGCPDDAAIAVRRAQRLTAPYLTARRRVFRQLLESLMFEGVLEPDALTEAEGWTLYRLHGVDSSGEPVAYTFKGRTRYTFGIVRLKADEPVMRRSGAYIDEAVSLTLFVREALMNALRVPGGNAERFAHELEETLAKDALALCRRDAADAGRLKLQGRPYEELEILSADGHPYHPCYKSRIGFSLKDHLTYGPEFEPAIPVVWLAASAADVRCSTHGPDWREVLADQLGAPALERFDGMLREQGLEPERYRYIPVHPWQWSKHLAGQDNGTGSALGSGRLVMLGDGPELYRPQQSIRTLAHRSDTGKSDLKLSLHITNTSSLRDLTVHSVAAAPAVSGWLQSIVDSDPYLKEEARVILLHEYAGASYLPAAGAASCIWRESVRKYMTDGEEAAPFHTLLASEPDGTPYIAPWLTRHGTERWLRSFIRQGCLPVVHLLVAHGIALESHAQNMVLIHRDGLPLRVALKDFHEGVEYYEPFLTAPERVPDFAGIHPAYAQGKPGDHFAMESVASLTEMLVDALLFMNAGYLAMLVEDKLGYPEEAFWLLFVRELEQYRAANPQLADRMDALDLFMPACRIERLASKRLLGPAHSGSGLYADRPQPEKPNPLHRARTNGIGEP